MVSDEERPTLLMPANHAFEADALVRAAQRECWASAK